MSLEETMIFNVHYGEAPFPIIGTVDSPDELAALQKAINGFAGYVPERWHIEEGMKYHLHPVVSPQ
jgi:hypothetical protein